MSEALRECPFCGHNVMCIKDQTNGRWFIVCFECDMLWGYSRTNGANFKRKKDAELAWNRHAQPDNPPLTLEQLRQMDGEPVWITGKDGNCGIWALITVHENAFVATAAYGTTRIYNKYGKTWLAYARKPEKDGGEE